MTSIQVHPNKIYLPDETSEDDRLNLLNTFQRNEDFFPFTEKQSLIFNLSKKADNVSKRYLGIKGYILSITIPLACNIILVLLPNKKNDALGTVLKISLTALSTISAAVMSMLFTGSFPDNSSDRKNEEQNELDILKQRFDNFAIYLLDSFFDPLKKVDIEDISKKINIQKYEEKLITVTTQKDKASQVFSFLKKVIHFINTGESKDSNLDIMIFTLGSKYRYPRFA